MDVINNFERLKDDDLDGAVRSLTRNVQSINSLRDYIRLQVEPGKFTQVLFEWLFNCIQLRDKSSDLFAFILQFSPDLLLVYLHAVYENNVQLKAMAETPLMGLLIDIEKDKPAQIQLPTLSKPSIYHKTTVQLAQSGLTEANLQRHNQTEYTPARRTFTGKLITVNNRLLFLSSVMDLFTDYLITFCHETRVAFCEACTIIAVQGMGSFFTSQITKEFIKWNVEELLSMRRYSISDSLVTSLLRGLRMCLFKSSHHVAVEALNVLKLRAEYELLTTAIQASHALVRLVQNVSSTEVLLDIRKQKSYHKEGSPKFENDPSEVHSVMNGHILYSVDDNKERTLTSHLVTKSTDV